MAQPGSNICFKCGINLTHTLFCVECSADNNDSDNDSDNDNNDDYKDDYKDEGVADHLVSFSNDSREKKQHYSQYKSFGNLTADIVDDSVVVDDPHFVLTLNNLDGYINNGAEMDKLTELKDCISNGQWRTNPILSDIRDKLGNVYGVDKHRVVINDIFYGTTNIGYYIVDYLKKGVQKLIKNAKEFMKKMKYTFEQFKELIITPPPKSKDSSYEVVKSYHVSCASRNPCKVWECKTHHLGGVVLYMKDGKTDWYCNGRHCKIGYIIVIPSEDTKHISGAGQIHGRTYKSVFNEAPQNVVASGFARYNGEWKWKSGVFNAQNDEWHTKGADKDYKCESRTMSDIEAKWIKKAVRNWFDTGNQNTNVVESIVIFKD